MEHPDSSIYPVFFFPYRKRHSDQRQGKKNKENHVIFRTK